MTTANCLGCGTTITVTTRNPNRRYCSPRCRKAAWQARRRTRDGIGDDAANGVTHDVDDVLDVVHPRNGLRHAVPAANGVTRCPHCRQKLAVVAVVIPAAAAHVQPPGGDQIALP
jgi:endogenous inhibitor of DNA gyrase (YacG/DUF329 family)